MGRCGEPRPRGRAPDRDGSILAAVGAAAGLLVQFLPMDQGTMNACPGAARDRALRRWRRQCRRRRGAPRQDPGDPGPRLRGRAGRNAFAGADACLLAAATSGRPPRAFPGVGRPLGIRRRAQPSPLSSVGPLWVRLVGFAWIFLSAEARPTRLGSAASLPRSEPVRDLDATSCHRGPLSAIAWAW